MTASEPWPPDKCIICEQPAVVTTAALDLRYFIDFSPLCAGCVGERWD